MFRHKKCGGTVILNMSKSMLLVSPGCYISPKGISPGAMEIQKLAKGLCGYLCLKCNADFTTDLSDVESMCMTCNEWFPVADVNVTEYITIICDTCLEALMGTVVPKDEVLKRLRECLSIPRDSSIVKLDTVMLKPV